MVRAAWPVSGFTFGVVLRAQPGLAQRSSQQLRHGLALGLVLMTLLTQGFLVGKHLGPFLGQRLQPPRELLIQPDAFAGLLLVALDLPMIDDFTQQRCAISRITMGQVLAVSAVCLSQGVQALIQLVAAAHLMGERQAGFAFAQLSQSQQCLQALGSGHWSNSSRARTVCS